MRGHPRIPHPRALAQRRSLRCSDLPPQLEEFVGSKVASGLDTSASEVVREALRLMDKQDQLREACLAQLRSDVRQGLASGSSQPWDAEALKSKARARRTNGPARG